MPSAGDVGKHGEIVARQIGDRVLSDLLYELNLPIQVGGRFLDPDDRAGLGQPRDGVREKISARP